MMRDSNIIMMRRCGFVFLASITLGSLAQDGGAPGSVYDEYVRRLRERAAAEQEKYAPALRKLAATDHTPIVRPTSFDTYDPDPTGAHTKAEGERNGARWGSDCELVVAGKLMSVDEIRKTEAGARLLQLMTDARLGHKRNFFDAITDFQWSDVPFLGMFASVGKSITDAYEVSDTIDRLGSGRYVSDYERVQLGLYMTENAARSQGTWGSKIADIVRKTPRLVIEFGFLVSMFLSLLKDRGREGKYLDKDNKNFNELKCPGCMAQLEVPSDVPEGIHIRCECCQTKFALRSKGEMEILDVPQRPQLPIRLKIALISMAVLSSFGFMGKAKDCFIASLLVYLILLGLLFGMWKGRRICRIIVSGLMVATWLFAAAKDTTAAMIIFGLWAIPLTFLWLPDSSEWFKKMRWWIRGMRGMDPKFKESSEYVRRVWCVVGGVLLYGAALLALSMHTDLAQVGFGDLHWVESLYAGFFILPILIVLFFSAPANYVFIPIVLVMSVMGAFLFSQTLSDENNDFYY